MKPWERMEEETDKSWAAFQAYRDLPPSERSVFAAAERLNVKISQENRKERRPPRGWQTWSTKFKWAERAVAWDREKDRVARETQLDEVRKMQRRQLNLAKSLYKKGFDALSKLKDEDLSAADVRLFIVDGAKLERTIYGEPEMVTEQRLTGPDGSPLEFGGGIDLSNLSSDDIRTLLAILRRAGSGSSEGRAGTGASEP